MSYNKSDINLDNCDLYEYVMELDQKDNSTKNRIEHLSVPKIERVRKDNSINMILIIAIVLILLGLYCYFTKSSILNNQNASLTPLQSNDLMTSYYLA
jgi:hypothetical protein